VSNRLPQRGFDLNPHLVGALFFRHEQSNLNYSVGFERYPFGKGEFMVIHALSLPA
jgi:hypothetical protein